MCLTLCVLICLAAIDGKIRDACVYVCATRPLCVNARVYTVHPASTSGRASVRVALGVCLLVCVYACMYVCVPVPTTPGFPKKRETKWTLFKWYENQSR